MIFMDRFTKAYKKILLEMTDTIDIAADFFTAETPEFKDVREKFEDTLNAELQKVKNADEYLENVYLSFDEMYDVDDADSSDTMMTVDPNDYEKINVNPLPFIQSYYEEFAGLDDQEERFKRSIAEYINISKYSDKNTGQHLIQHECAHILDIMNNGELRYDMHDEKFNKIRKELNDKTSLDM